MYKKSLFLIVLFCAAVNAQWIQTNAPRGMRITSMAVSGKNLIAGTWENGVFISTDNGTNWTAIDSGLTNNYVNALAVTGNNLFAGTYEGVFVSTNNGTNWTAVSANNNLNPYPTLVKTFATRITDTGTDLFAGGTSLKVSSDNGTSWGIIDNVLDGNEITSLAINGTSLFVGSGYNGIYYFTNYGRSWYFIKHCFTNKYVYSLAVQGTNLFAAINDGVYLSTDSGTNWVAVKNGMAYPYANSLFVNGTNIFAGTGGGVYLSTNNGTNWAAVNDGLNNDIIVISFAVSGAYIFISTLNNGIWMRPLSEVITDVKNRLNNLPTSFSLQQNFPNPFNPTTTIDYSLPKSEFVTIKLYDAIGREIKTLVKGQKTAGNYSMQFNGSNLSSGIYFYRMQSGNYVETRKLLLLK